MQQAMPMPFPFPQVSFGSICAHLDQFVEPRPGVSAGQNGWYVSIDVYVLGRHPIALYVVQQRPLHLSPWDGHLVPNS